MLKVILLRKRLNDAERQETEIRQQMAAFETRESELATEIETANTEADRTRVEAAVAELDNNMTQTREALQAVQTRIAELRTQIDEAEAAQQAAASAEARSTGSGLEQRTGSDFERRCAEFQRTGRMHYDNLRSLVRASILPTSTGVIGPSGVSGINDAAGLTVSSFIDLIKVTDCTGMASYKVAYLSGDGTAAAGTYGTVPTESGPTFGSVELTPNLVNIIEYISREIRKQSPLLYENKVQEATRRALRRILNKNAVDAVIASNLNDTLAKTAAAGDATGEALFTPSLLSDIILAYGGDEGVDGAAYLVLNKADLKAFAAVRGTNEYLPVYSITPDSTNPNVGVIKDNNGLSCRYCLSKDVAALSTMTLTTTAQKSMFYGNPQCAEMGLWGDIEVTVNDGYKFGEGLLTIMGEAMADADVTTPKGFVIVTAEKASA